MKPIRLVSTGALLLLLGGMAAPNYAKQPQGRGNQQQDQNDQQQGQGKPEQGKNQDQKKQPQPRGQQQPQGQNAQPPGRGQPQPQRGQQPQQGQNAQQSGRGQQPQQGQNAQQPGRGQQPQQGQNAQQSGRGQQPQRGQPPQAPSQQQQQQARQQQPVWQEHRATNWQTEHRTWQQRGGYTAERIPDDRFRSSFGADHAFRIYSNPVVVTGGYPGFLYSGFYFSVVDPWPEYWSDNWYDNDDVYIDYSGDGYYLYNRRYPQDRISIGVYLNFVQQGDRRGMWLKYRSRSWQAEHRTWQQRGGYKGYRIPDDRYRPYFGQDHRFRVNGLPLVLEGGYPRFQYGGFWFSVVDPWPEYWSDNWYDNDDVYIDYSGDGYYMYNHSHPQDRIAINVYVN